MDFLEDSYVYHIYNRGIDKKNIFREEENYYYFLKLCKKHLQHSFRMYAYCLLPNHFHFLVRVNGDEKKASQAMSNLFNAYAKAFNKKYDRTGSLFERAFKRIRVTEERYLKQLVVYIHLNPELHNVFNYFEQYPFSSYKSMLSTRPTNLVRDDVIGWFDTTENFVMHHKEQRQLKEDSELALE